MYFARHFPGLQMSLEHLEQMTVEEIKELRTVGGKLLRSEGLERIEHTKAIMRAAAGRF